MFCNLQIGLASLLNSVKIYDGFYHSLGLHVRSVCQVILYNIILCYACFYDLKDLLSIYVLPWSLHTLILSRSIYILQWYNVLVFRMPSASPQQQSWNKPWLLCMTPQQIKMANKVIIENNNNHFSWIDDIEISERK